MPTRRSAVKGLTALLSATALPAWASDKDPAAALADQDGIALAAHIARKHFTARDLLDAAIARAKATNPSLNFMAQDAHSYGRNALDTLASEAPYSGVPTLMKDLAIDLPGIPTGNGSRFWKDYVGTSRSTLVKRYEAAGLVIFGKTTTPELGLTATTESAATGDTRNPWDRSKTAGGSSGGAAVAVAAGVVPFAQASDGGGSIRTPASCCGLFGLKPSRGRVPLGPTRTEGWMGLSTAHAVTRSVRDSALLLDLSSGPELGARYGAPAPASGSFLAATLKAPRPLKIALMLSPPSGAPVASDCLYAANDVAKLCEKLGHKVDVASPTFPFEEINEAMLAVLTIETKLSLDARAQALGRPYGPKDVEPVTLWMAQSALKQSPTAYAQANRVFQKLAIDVAAFMQDYDVVLSPTLAKAPVDIGRLSLSPTNFDDYVEDVTTFGPFTAWSNQTGQPSMSVPLNWNKDELPIGTMFTGRYGEDDVLLALAAQLERARPWFDRRPKLSI